MAHYREPGYEIVTAKFDTGKNDRRLLITAEELQQVMRNAQTLQQQDEGSLPPNVFSISGKIQTPLDGMIPANLYDTEGYDDDGYDFAELGAAQISEVGLSQDVLAENDALANASFAQQINMVEASTNRSNDFWQTSMSTLGSMNEMVRISNNPQAQAMVIEGLLELQQKVKAFCLRENGDPSQLQGAIVSSNIAMDNRRVYKRIKSRHERRARRLKVAPRDKTNLSADSLLCSKNYTI